MQLPLRNIPAQRGFVIFTRLRVNEHIPPSPVNAFHSFHTSSGSVPGAAGNVDLSIAYKDYTSIICKNGLTRLREDE